MSFRFFTMRALHGLVAAWALFAACGSLAADSDAADVQSELVVAATRGDADGVARLLDAGADVNERDAKGATALHVAAFAENRTILAQLIAAGADVNAAATGTSWTPLHMAGAVGNSAIAKALIEAGAAVDAAGRDGSTPLHMAAAYNRGETARVLIAAGGSPKAASAGGVTPLHVAATQGAREVAEVLVGAGAVLEAVDSAGHTPLHHAANRVFEDAEQGVAQLLIAAGANVKAVDNARWTPLHMAVRRMRHILAEALLDAGADANASAGGTTPLHFAAKRGDLDCALLLLRRGASPNPPTAPGVRPPLLVAIDNDREYVAAALVEHGADAGVKDENGETAAAKAEREGMTEVLVRLHEREVDEARPPAADIDPETLARLLYRAIERDAPDTVLRLLNGVDVDTLAVEPLHEAVRHGSRRVVAALLDAGFDVNAGTTTPLHEAARHEAAEVAALLVERGAKVNASDGGWTPLHYALLRGTDRPGLQVANLLVEHGADVNAASGLVGWTPLHLAAHLGVAWSTSDEASERKSEERDLAHGPDVVGFVRTLMERGAQVNARTRIGGWTPMRVVGLSGQYFDHLDLKALTVALRDAGGKEKGCEDAPRVPVYSGGHAHWPSERQGLAAASAPECEHAIPFSVPSVMDTGAWTVAGSFTAPDANERLLFESVGTLEWNEFRLFALQDQRGAIHPVMAFDHYTKFRGLCLDRESGTHTAVFRRAYDGTCCPWVDTAYFHHDAESGAFAEVFVDGDADDATPGSNAEQCGWREKMAALDAFEEAVRALGGGEAPAREPDGRPRALATRAIPTDVVAAQLDKLRALPTVAQVRRPEIDSPRWKVVIAEYVGVPRPGSVDVCEGVTLVWDGQKEEWHSIYDCANLFDIEVVGNRLSAALYVGTATCGIRRLGLACYLEVDLTTHVARLWDEPHGGYWSNSRERPDG